MRFLSPVIHEGMLPEMLFEARAICSMYPVFARPQPSLKFPEKRLFDRSRNCRFGAVESTSEIFTTLHERKQTGVSFEDPTHYA